jgi:hypothetical protein
MPEESKLPAEKGWRHLNNPVSVVVVVEVIGTIFLGILALWLLISWRRSETRYHALVEYLIEER